MKIRNVPVNLAAMLALIAMCGAAEARAQKYSLTTIPAPIGVFGPCVPVSVNDRGQAVGYTVEGNDPTTERPFVFDPVSGSRLLTGLTFYAGTGSRALAINHAGVVVGYYEQTSGLDAGFVWDSVNGARPIGSIADSNGITAASLGWYIDAAWSINAKGDILVSDDHNGLRIGIWRMTTSAGISTLAVIPVPYDSLATGIVGLSTQINDQGIVMTYQPPYASPRQPMLWDSNTDGVTDVKPSLGLSTGLNNNGVAVGNGVTYDAFGGWYATNVAWLYSANGALTNLGSLGGGAAHAAGINDVNQVVGYSTATDGSSRAFIWQGGVMADLNQVINPGKRWSLTVANAISNPARSGGTAGYIVGTGYYSGTATGWFATPK